MSSVRWAQTMPREANPRNTHGVVIVQDHDADAASHQVERCTEAAEPAADDDDGVRRVLWAVELAGAFVGIDGKF